MADATILKSLKMSSHSNRLGPEDHVAYLTQMLRIRHFELSAKELFLSGTIKGTAHSSVGQEAIAVGACSALEPRDFLLTHHRGHGHTLAKGANMTTMFAELMGKAGGYCHGIGGSMHIADFDLNILGANGIVGAGIGIGTGAALAAKLEASGAIGISFFGDGASNEGIFHEAMNLSAIWKLPLIFLCENNQYGLTTPTEMMIAGNGIAARGDAYGIPNECIDGNDPAAVFMAVERAALRARSGEGPSLIEAMTYRWDDHSMRANLPEYRTKAEEDGWKTEDPISRQREKVLEIGEFSISDYDSLVDTVKVEVEEAIDKAKTFGQPKIEDAISMVKVLQSNFSLIEPVPGERTITYGQAINEAFHQEMQRDPSVIIMGEDVARIGGIFGITTGLYDSFGPERVRDFPIAEGVLSSCGVGAALQGLRPIIEIQLFDFVTLMMDAIVNQAAKARFMLGGKAKVPIVFRGPQGAGIRLAAQHSQSLEMLFANIPGLEIYAPSNAYDAKGLMAAAIRSDNPVIFLEHKFLYLSAEQPVPEEEYVISPGRGRVMREGTDVTVVATMAMVDRAIQAAERLEKKGISVEVIDPRTIKPLDMEIIVESVKKTNRAVVVHEAPLFGGFGGEIAAGIMEQAFDWLDAPVVRIGAPEMPVPYNDGLEREYMPDARDITGAIETVCYRK